MRQYDTKNSRIVLICAKRSLCAAFSVLPYGEGLRVSDLRVDSQKQRHPSGGVSVSSEMVFQLEGVELGADGKPDSHGPPPQPRPSAPRALLGPRCKPIPPRAAPAGSELGADAGDALEYNPDLLDDPQWPCGKHKRVLIFASYMVGALPRAGLRVGTGGGGSYAPWAQPHPHLGIVLSGPGPHGCRPRWRADAPGAAWGRSLSIADHSDRVREALRPQEGHERDLPGEVPAHQADAEQNQEVRRAEAGVPKPAAARPGPRRPLSLREGRAPPQPLPPSSQASASSSPAAFLVRCPRCFSYPPTPAGLLLTGAHSP
nr:CDK5 and ABL1 enzyme substrate 2 isoform X2 [Globicephala melas]